MPYTYWHTVTQTFTIALVLVFAGNINQVLATGFQVKVFFHRIASMLKSRLCSRFPTNDTMKSFLSGYTVCRVLSGSLREQA